VTGLARRVDRWLFAPGPASRVWGLRIGLTAVMGVRLAITPYHQLSDQPAALFRPPPFLQALGQMPSEVVVLVAQGAGVVAALFVLAGRRVRLAFAATWVSFVFLEGLIDSRAKISHHQIPVILAAVPLLLAPAVASWRDRDDDARTGWPPRVAMVVVAGVYFFCGFAKLMKSGPAWFTSDNLRWVMASGARSAKPPTQAVAQFIADHDLLAHALALGTLAIELSFLLVLFRARLRPVYVAAAVSLHVGIWVTLGLDYWSWVAAVIVVVLPWENVLPAGQTRSAKRVINPSTS
jgi:hypothetical protein